jgi:hypothetical protein
MYIVASNKTYLFIERYSSYILFAIWSCVQIYLFLSLGINTGGESLRALNDAGNLYSGKSLSSPGGYMYFTETVLIFLKMKAHLGTSAIILFQLTLNFAALIYLQRFLIKFYNSKILAFAGCSLLVICYPYQIYHFSFYTESVFFSLSIFYSCYLLKLKSLSLKSATILIALLFLLCVTRPSGIFFIAATLVYLYFFLTKKISAPLRSTIFILLTCTAVFLLNFMIGLGSGGGIDLILPFKDERIICGVPTLSYNVNIDTIKNSNSIMGLFYYVTHNFHQFFRLALLKSKVFFGLTRPYYSLPHNLFLITYFYSLYILIISNFFRKNRKLPMGFIYLFSIILIYWLSVLFSCDEWHNRFFLTLTPFLIIPALWLFKGRNSNFPHDAQQ